MSKDLHSSKVEDWNVVIVDCHVFLTYDEGDKAKVRAGYSLHKDGIVEIAGERLPIEIRDDINEFDDRLTWVKYSSRRGCRINKNGNMIWLKYSNKYEYRYDDKGIIIWQKDPNGNEYGYDEDGKTTWMKWLNGKEFAYDAKGHRFELKRTNGIYE